MKLRNSYIAAKKEVEKYESEILKIEQNYINLNHIHNDDGEIPNGLDDIDDMDVFENAADEVYTFIEKIGLEDKLTISRGKLKKIEDELIDFGIKFLKSHGGEINKKDLFTVVYREKFINTILNVA